MRVILAIAMVGSITSCARPVPPEVAQCEERLIGKLKAPSTYKKVKVDVTDINPSNPEDIEHPKERWVTITYDAVNSYNAPIRGSEMCRYPLRGKEPDLANVLGDDDGLPSVDQMVTNIGADAVPNAPPIEADDGGINADEYDAAAERGEIANAYE